MGSKSLSKQRSKQLGPNGRMYVVSNLNLPSINGLLATCRPTAVWLHWLEAVLKARQHAQNLMGKFSCTWNPISTGCIFEKKKDFWLFFYSEYFALLTNVTDCMIRLCSFMGLWAKRSRVTVNWVTPACLEPVSNFKVVRSLPKP